ncbi:MAG: V-type ATP synthase subunit D, partial [Spirochaetales bacterium]|nr:V-type ATP synthase subunit D [Spirochaetales bacterium]
SVFGENSAFCEERTLDKLVRPDKVVRREGNIAGVNIPIIEDLTVRPIDYAVEDYPLWVDQAVVLLQESARISALMKTLEMQVELLGRELRTTSQRVNLFEKVKIPETKENIRKIGIYIGDQQTAAVVRGKIAKRKLSSKEEQDD